MSLLDEAERIRRENAFAANWTNPKMNKFGYLDNMYTRMFGTTARGGNPVGDLLHRPGVFQSQVGRAKLSSMLGGPDKVARFEELWRTGNAVQAAKEFPSVLKASSTYSPPKPPTAGLLPSLSNKTKSVGAGIGASLFGAKTLMGAPAASAFGLAPLTSAALVAGAGAAAYGLGRGLNRATGGAIDHAAQEVWQPLTDQAYGVKTKPDRMRGLWLGTHPSKR
jgi:hypothetical protein